MKKRIVVGVLLMLLSSLCFGCGSPTMRNAGEQTGESPGAYPPCVKIGDVIYKDTGYESAAMGCGVMDGEITSSVDGSQLPSENGQSNFGTGYEYQWSTEGQVIVVIDDARRIFRDSTSSENTIPEQVMHFDAEVKEVSENGVLLVSYVDQPDFFFPMTQGNYTLSADSLQDTVAVGDLVTIWFDGNIMETDPAQLGQVYRVEKKQAD